MEIFLEYRYEIAIVLIVLVISIITFLFKMKKGKKGISIESSNDLILALGGGKNVVSCEHQVSRLNVIVRDTDLVKTDKIMELGARGAYVSNDKVQIMLGENAKLITDKLQEFL